MKQPPTRKYCVLKGVGHDVTEETLNADQLAAIDRDEFDLVISKITAEMIVRLPSGKRVKYTGRWPRMGPSSSALLEALLLNTTEFVSPKELAELCANTNMMENTALAARILSLRKTLGDCGEHFIETQKTPGHYAVRWTGRPWLMIERAPADARVTQAT